MASIVVEAVSLIGVFIACGIAYALGYKQGMDTMSRIDNRIIEEAVKEIYGEDSKNESGSADSAGRAGGNGR